MSLVLEVGWGLDCCPHHASHMYLMLLGCCPRHASDMVEVQEQRFLPHHTSHNHH